MFGKNWTTTLPGIGAILAAIGNILAGLADPGMIDWVTNLGAIFAGVGLIFAKSHNVTGGTVMQPSSTQALTDKAVELKAPEVKAALHGTQEPTAAPIEQPKP